MKGYVHSLQSLGTVDGPGVRAVVFTEGCPLRCIYCHNPDTWTQNEEHLTEASEIAEKIFRLYPYIKNGGVTFSGGEPCMQAEFLFELASLLKEKGLHIALDTSGAVYNEKVEKLLSVTDLVLLDIKMTDDESYKNNIGMSLKNALDFLGKLNEMKKETWIRHVVIPGINDNEENIHSLKELISPFSCITKTELLPFRTLCIEKYESLGIDFPLKNTKDMDKERIKKLWEML